MKITAWILALLGGLGLFFSVIYIATPKDPASCGDGSCPTSLEAAFACLLPALLVCAGAAWLFRASHIKQERAQTQLKQAQLEKARKEEQALLGQALQGSNLPRECLGCGAPLGDVEAKLINGVATIVCPYCHSRYK